jgi:hypothetical protein
MRRSGLAAILAVALACSDGGDAVEPLDTTRPAVATREPALGDREALASGPYRVVFTEPLDAGSVDPSAVRVWQAAGRIPAAVALSPDGTVLTIRPLVVPDIPGWVYVELTPALRDRAGNALAPEELPWTFELPTWVQPGGPGPISPSDGPNPSPSVALDAEGGVVVGMANLRPDPVVRFADAAWTALPNPPSFGIHAWIAADEAGGLWHADVAGAQVNRFTGTAWARVGGDIPPSNPTAYAWDARVVVREDRPVLLWSEYLTPEMEGGPATSLHASAWDGTAWVSWGEQEEPALWPSLAIGATGAVAASWSGTDVGVALLGPLGFERLVPPNSAPFTGTTAVAVGHDGRPLVAFGEYTPDGDLAVVVMAWTGEAWWQLGEPLSAHTPAGPVTPALAVDGAGRPVVAWTEGAYYTARKLYVARFDGAAWQRLGGPLNVDPDHGVYRVALTTDALGAPVLAWAEQTGVTRLDSAGEPYDVYAMYVKRLNR